MVNDVSTQPVASGYILTASCCICSCHKLYNAQKQVGLLVKSVLVASLQAEGLAAAFRLRQRSFGLTAGLLRLLLTFLRRRTPPWRRVGKQ